MRYNKMAVIALVCAVLVPPFGILMGHIAWAQTRRTGERGHRLALAALVIGYVELLVLCGVPIVVLGF
ncbi:DUF4190 domain-containing protein [Dactylosporangium sp. NBC_01737]|uniref:DUF4190 domain-containing protein n=1 Tax=Dactylosporangium sp. NBC_01737 TaxID=2975959 RepID=UPI002E1168D8|nr:DUF4190 domain-containing protein [Dactylosporangium sp. NBC_01737]